MRIEAEGDTLRVSEIPEMVASSTTQVRREILTALTEAHRNIDVDLSKTTFVDSSGLGALIGLHRTASRRNGVVRLLSPGPQVMQVLQLTRMYRVFEIAPRPAESESGICIKR